MNRYRRARLRRGIRPVDGSRVTRETAPVSARAIAFALDIVAGALPISLVMVFVLEWLGAPYWTVVIFGPSFLLYFMVAESIWSTTPWKRVSWKRVYGLEVVTPDGSEIGAWRAFIRNLALLIDMQPVLLLPVGMVIALLDPENRRGGDFLASTYVVHSRSTTINPT